MWTTLLPGFREARADVASGLLLVYVAWMATGQALADAFGGGRSDPALSKVVEFLGEVGSAVVLLGGAYLVGTLWTTAVGLIRSSLWHRSILRNPEPVLESSTQWSDYFSHDLFRPFSYRSHRRILLRLQAMIGDDAWATSDAVRPWIQQVLRETLFVGPALLTSAVDAASEAYAECMRTRSEGELRDAIALPLAVAGILTVSDSRLSFVAQLGLSLSISLASTALFLVGRKLTRDANSQIAHSVASGAIKTTSMALIEDRQVDLDYFLRVSRRGPTAA